MNSRSWMHEMFGALDTDGVPGLFAYLDEDVVFRFGNFPPGRGRQTFHETWVSISPHIDSLSHDLLDVWDCGDSAVCRGNVTYELKDGSVVTLPFANVFYLRDGKIVEYLIHIDASAVFGPGSP